VNDPSPDEAPLPSGVPGSGDVDGARRGRRAGWVAAVGLLLVYTATLAPGITFWDAGELAAAFARFGIPHPPGTPLFVAAGRGWSWALTSVGVAHATASNLLSAVCTAAAAGVAARLLARWTRSEGAAVSGALCAGATSSVWLSATETEVYAAALLLSWLAIAAADRAAADRRTLFGGAYALGLAVPLHLSALAVTPAAAVLAAFTHEGTPRLSRGAALLAAGVAAAGAGSGRWWLAAAGALAAAALATRDRWRGSQPCWSRGAAMLAVLALALSAALILLLRGQHDPALNQGNPATWQAFADVLARRQYAVAPLWPRSAPYWLQLGNLGEWADWQFALGLDGGLGPSARRTPFTLAYLALGVVGARWHWRRDRRSCAALAVLLLATSVGVATYLNMRLGPTFGWGVVPDGALREARERDYFFAVAFFTWGLWAGTGAWALGASTARRLAGRMASAARAAGVLLAALPIALNWRAADRRRQPDAALPGAFADALLASAPPGGILLLHADNDSYPVWYAQLARGVRPDVATVTVSLLGAAWYRAELARRHALLPPESVRVWRGTDDALRAVARQARRAGRPLATSLAVPSERRAVLGGAWTLRGIVIAEPAPGDSLATAPPALASALRVGGIELRTARRVAAGVAPLLVRSARTDGDGVTLWAQRQLACPARALAEVEATRAPGAAAVRVETACRAW
jgi:hypothetical protein